MKYSLYIENTLTRTNTIIYTYIRVKEKEAWSFLPPSFRDYGSGQAFHSKCLPNPC
jgi:hypothetical protein